MFTNYSLFFQCFAGLGLQRLSDWCRAWNNDTTASVRSRQAWREQTAPPYAGVLQTLWPFLSEFPIVRLMWGNVASQNTLMSLKRNGSTLYFSKQSQEKEKNKERKQINPLSRSNAASLRSVHFHAAPVSKCCWTPSGSIIWSVHQSVVSRRDCFAAAASHASDWSFVTIVSEIQAGFSASTGILICLRNANCSYYKYTRIVNSLILRLANFYILLWPNNCL